MTAEKILITGGTGTIGSYLTQLLAERGVRVRLLVRNPERAAAARKAGFALAQGDLTDPASLNRAMDGADRILLLSSPEDRQRELHANAIRSAKSVGVRHIVRVSAFGADPSGPTLLARSHGECEQELEASGLAYTHVRPHSFMQNFFGYLGTIHAYGIFYGCMKDGKIAMVDARDIASVCAECLTGTGHEGRTYVVTGPEAISMGEAAQALSSACGEPIHYVDLPPEQFERGARDSGMPAWLAHDLAWLCSNVFAAGLGAEITGTVAEVTGKAPLRFADFARDYADRFRKPAA
jgi:uncharacterized protein YbjT (DUF2867 family)